MKIVHDYMIQMGGAERVVALMADTFREAPLYTSATEYETLFPEFQGREVVNTWMQRISGIERCFKKLFPLYPFAFKGLGKIDADIVWLSSSGFAKWTEFTKNTPVFCYCHTPPRFFWQPDSYLPLEVPNRVLQSVVRALLPVFRKSDYKAAQKMTHFIANSRAVQQRIKEFYHRDSMVINPPVNVKRFEVSSRTDDYFLIVSRLVGYKSLDRAIVGFSKLGKRLVVAGNGPDEARLRSLAGPTVEFRGRVTDDEVTKLMQNCYALVFPGLEDFGITPVEAMACGKPVLAFGGGGALETVVAGKSGLFFYEPTAESLAATISEFERQTWIPSEIRQVAERFSEEIFLDKMIGYMEQKTGLDLSRQRQL